MKPFYWASRKFLQSLFWIGYRYKVYGWEHVPQGGAIIAANHASFMDPPLIAASSPEEIAYLAHERLFENPFFRWLIKKLNAHPLKEETQNNLESFKKVLKLLKEQKKVVIFPEGNRTEDGEMQPLKTGIAMIALRAPCVIIPTYLHGTYEAWPRFKRFPKLGPKLVCIFGKPIAPGQFEQVDKKQAQEAMTAEIERSLRNLKLWYEKGAEGVPP